MADIIQILPELEGEEMLFVSGLVKEMHDDQARNFAIAYRSQRRDPDTVLLLSLLGFLGLAGVHRFYLEQIGMCLIFFLTLGLCVIGTIIDIVNYKDLTFKYNQQKALTISTMIKGSM